MVEVTRCISDRAQRCYWELEYKWCVSTGTARYGGLHFHDQFYQTAPLGATPQMGWIASRVGGWRNPPNCCDPTPVLKKAFFCVLQCKKKITNKQTQQQQQVPVPAALNHYAMITSAKVDFSSGSLQVKNAHVIPAVGSKRLESAAKHLQVDRKLVCVCVCCDWGRHHSTIIVLVRLLSPRAPWHETSSKQLPRPPNVEDLAQAHGSQSQHYLLLLSLKMKTELDALCARAMAYHRRSPRKSGNIVLFISVD